LETDVIENFVDKLTNPATSLKTAGESAKWFWGQPKALAELWRQQKIMALLKEDCAFFCTLNLRLPTGVFTTQPFQVGYLRDTHKRICVCCGRQVGKTTMSAGKNVHFACTHPYTTSLIISRSQRQSIHMFDIVRNMFFWNPILKGFLSYPGTTRTRIRLKNHAQIIALPTGSDGETILGQTAHKITIDEANFIKPSIITEVVFPMISSTDGALDMLSTPEYAEHPFMKAFYNYEELGYHQYHFPSSIAPFPTKEAKLRFLKEQKKTIPEDEYMRQYEAILPDESNQLIATRYIRKCIDSTYTLYTEEELFAEQVRADFGGYDPGGRVNPAAFVALKNDKANVEKIDGRGKPYRTSQKAWRLVFVREKKGEGYTEFTLFVQGAQSVLHMRKLGVDSKGLGGPLCEDLEHALGKNRVEGFPIGDKLKVDLFKWLRTCFEQGYIIIPDDDNIIRQLKALKWRWVEVSTAKERAVPKLRYDIYHGSTPDDVAFATAIALYVAAQKRGGKMLRAY